MDKLKHWMDIAQNMHGGDFWKNIFDQEFAKQFINDQPFGTSNNGAGDQSNRPQEKNPRSFPIIDILEREEEVVILIELPGVIKENIELGLNGNILTVKGIVNPIQPQAKLVYSERFYGEFQRQITLSDTVSPNELTAKFWNGILFVSYQRTMEKGERIPID